MADRFSEWCSEVGGSMSTKDGEKVCDTGDGGELSRTQFENARSLSNASPDRYDPLNISASIVVLFVSSLLMFGIFTIVKAWMTSQILGIGEITSDLAVLFFVPFVSVFFVSLPNWVIFVALFTWIIFIVLVYSTYKGVIKNESTLGIAYYPIGSLVSNGTQLIIAFLIASINIFVITGGKLDISLFAEVFVFLKLGPLGFALPLLTDSAFQFSMLTWGLIIGYWLLVLMGFGLRKRIYSWLKSKSL